MYKKKGRGRFGHAPSHHPDEPPAGDSSTRCSPAELVSASPANSILHECGPAANRRRGLVEGPQHNYRAGDGLDFRAAAITLYQPIFCPKNGVRLTNGSFITGRCGWTHMPPNTTTNYDYENMTSVSSDIEDWTPETVGQTKQVNALTWGSIPYTWPSGEVRLSRQSLSGICTGRRIYPVYETRFRISRIE
ncbi:MAG TPA: hypothetical protein VJX67_17040 [Blastocatellia bacterium]|nr:hypothetical protein [Blastocatellia bacterium]